MSDNNERNTPPQQEATPATSATSDAATSSTAAAADASDSQSAKRQCTTRVTDSASSGAMQVDADESRSDSTPAPSVAAAASSSSSSSAPGPSSASLSAAKLAEIRQNLQRYMQQVTVGCGVQGCSNRECVTGGASRLTREQSITKAKQLMQARIPSCVAQPPAATTTAAVTSSPAAAPVTNGASGSAAAATSSPAVALEAPAAAAAAAAAVNIAPLPVTPARPHATIDAPSSATAAASSSPTLAAAASSSVSSSPALMSLSPPTVSPSLSAMLAGSVPSLPLTSIEPPIIDVAEWVSSVDAARHAWEAAGSPINNTTVFRPLMTRVYQVFSSIECIALSFRIRKDEEDRSEERRVQEPSSKEHRDGDTPMSDASAPAATSVTSSEFVEATEFSPAVDYDALDAFYESVCSVVVPQPDGSEQRPILNSLSNGLRYVLNQYILRPMSSHQMYPALLRMLPIIYENASVWFDPGNYELFKVLCKFMSVLPRTAKKLVVSWMADVERWRPESAMVRPLRPSRMYSVERLERLLGALQQFCSVRLFDKESLSDVAPAVVFISLIHEANETFAQWLHAIPLSVPGVARVPQPLPATVFYNDAVNECVDLKQDYRRWLLHLRSGGGASAAASVGDFSFFKYNFILDAASKASLLKYDSQTQQHSSYRDNMIAAGMDQRAGYLILEVRRNHLVADTMRGLANKAPADYKKPLKVHFVGEKGIDAGGLRNELFSLLVGELFDPKFGMFLVDEETRTSRFNPDSLDSPLEFELIGALLGIAIYNTTILNLRLPQVVYKQLLGMKPNIDDLLDAQPALARGLMQMLEFDGDVEATFGLNFTVAHDSYGEKVVVALKEDGENIAVTNDNRLEYVNLYVEYILEKSIAKQFGAFYKGFHRACGGEALKLFRPFELELLVCGISELDFEALESTARYDDGYTADNNIIKWFWEVVHQDLTLEEKKKLLEFCTGSDRVPIRGLASMHLTISKQGPDSDQLPTSHTCFHHLLLPDYESKEKLTKLLRLALQNSKGFGLI